MASEEEIAKGLERLFRETNPSSFNSLNQVILRLQSILGLDLSDKIDFIRDHITLLLTPPPPKPPSPPPSSFISPPFSTPLNPNPNPVISRPIPTQLNPNPNPNPVISRPVPSSVSHNAVISRPVPSPVNPNPSSVISRSFRSSVNPSSDLSVVQHSNVSYYPNNVPHHPHSRQHVFQSSSHFPRGPTEISFAQPSASGGIVVADSIASPPANAKDSGQKPKRRGGPGGLNKLCGVTPQLQTIVGQPAMPRTEIVKQLWAYIRKNNLQDPSNKRKIICNDELRLVFEVDCTDMFQMNKLLAKHILPLDSKKDSGQPSKKLKVDESQAPSPKPALPIVISDALAKFFGTGEKEMLQPDVYKRVEEYIKTEGLEDPLNSTVVCDPKLQELLGCESITASAIRDALSRNHLFQRA